MIASDVTIVANDRLSVVERAVMLIINDKIYNCKSLTSLSNEFWFTYICSTHKHVRLCHLPTNASDLVGGKTSTTL